MNYKKELDKEMKDRLVSHGIWLSNNALPVTKEKALILIGQAMLDEFVKDFVGLWKNELFPHCKIRDYKATDEDWRNWLGDDYANSKYCKGVGKNMDVKMKEKLDNYLELLDEISEKTDSEAAALAILHELCKDRRSQQIREEREERRSNNSDNVTFKQKNCLKRLGVEFPDDITRKEASALIKEELDRLNEVA